MKTPSYRWLLLVVFSLAVLGSVANSAVESEPGTLVTERFTSNVLRNTRTGLNPERTLKVYLPPGYSKSTKAYPVVYYCHSVFQSSEQVVADGKIEKLLTRGFASGVVPEFIFVVGDYTSPTTGCLYENTAATGRWIDYTVEELVPYVDGRFRTLRRPESRGVAGEMMGGRGAFMLAMMHPELFSVLYAMNPVGTGTGLLPFKRIPTGRKSFARNRSRNCRTIISRSFLLR